MSDHTQNNSDKLSALMDGALQGEELARALEAFANDAAVDDTWDTYHLVGQAMRASGETWQAHDPAFLARLRVRLAEDALESVAVVPLPIRAEGQKIFKEAANDPWWRRVAGLASVAAVGLLAWQGLVWMGPGQPTEATLAQQSAAPVTRGTPQALVSADGGSPLMIRDPQLDALLAAHRQLGGATALQMPAGFLRNATFSEDKR